MIYVIGEPCVDVLDRACVEECPVDCLYEGERMLYIHPDECVDCGAWSGRGWLARRCRSGQVPDIPSLLLRDPDLARIVRRSGGTIAPDGGPLATARRRRIRQWRQKRLALPSQVIPAVIDPDQVARPGLEGLGYLADLASTVGLRPRLPVHAGTEQRRDDRPAAARQQNPPTATLLR